MLTTEIYFLTVAITVVYYDEQLRVTYFNRNGTRKKNV